MDRKPHIVHLSSVHPASDTRIFYKECRSLAAAGFDVTLVASAHADASLDGVNVKAIKRHSGANRLRRVLQLVKIARTEKADAYHLHDPELIPVGLVLKARGHRVVFDIHERVAKQITTKEGIPKPLRKLVAMLYSVLEWLATRVFDGVVVADPEQVPLYPTQKVCLVENFAIVEEYDATKSRPYLQRPPQVAYVGGLTRHRGVYEMAEAIRRVGEQRDVVLALAGKFSSDSLQNEIVSKSGTHARIEYRGFLDRKGVYDLYDQSRVGIVILHPIPNYVTSQPVKLLEYMLAGLPVVVCNFPYYRQYVQDIGCGLMVDPLDTIAIADAILWLLENPEEAEAMGRRGREAVLARYNWEHEAEKLVEFYRTRVFA